MGRPSKYTPEFREEAVRLHHEQGGPVDAGERAGATREEHAEIVRLKRELRRVEEEKLILQKAAAYFARETDRR